jgi:hypothetical protein
VDPRQYGERGLLETRRDTVVGKSIHARDRASSLKVAILNESAARESSHGMLGKRVNFPGQRVTAEYEVVGWFAI